MTCHASAGRLDDSPCQAAAARLRRSARPQQTPDGHSFHLWSVTGSAADGPPGLARARQTIASAQVLLTTDPSNALVLAYDAARQACTARLAQQGLRPTTTGGHVAVDRILPHLDLFG
jgi:hypothetical protein